MKNYEKNEKIVKAFSIFSITSIAIGLIFGILSLIFKKNYLDTIAVYGLAMFVLPFMALQVAMPTNWHTYGIKSLGGWSWLFFLVMFPFVDLWFFSAINALYDIVPDYHIIKDRTLSEMARSEAMKQSWTYIGIMYVSLVGLGFFLRIFKNSKPTLMLA